MKPPPETNDQQLQILILLYRFRFLHRVHIQQFLHQKSHSRLYYWLKDLQSKKLIKSRYSHAFGENIKPTVYRLATKSKYKLAAVSGIDGRYVTRIHKDDYKTSAFITRCLRIADFYFYFSRFARQNNQQLHFFTKHDLKHQPHFPRPLPDAYVALKAPKKQTDRYFIESPENDAPKYALKHLVTRYIDYYDDRTWQNNNNGSFPSIIFICPAPAIQSFLTTYIADTIGNEGITDIHFFVIGSSAIGQNDFIWQKIEPAD
jgi:DNA-binding PadR family transcriptional regulator